MSRPSVCTALRHVAAPARQGSMRTAICHDRYMLAVQAVAKAMGSLLRWSIAKRSCIGWATIVPYGACGSHTARLECVVEGKFVDTNAKPQSMSFVVSEAVVTDVSCGACCQTLRRVRHSSDYCAHLHNWLRQLRESLD